MVLSIHMYLVSLVAQSALLFAHGNKVLNIVVAKTLSCWERNRAEKHLHFFPESFLCF